LSTFKFELTKFISPGWILAVSTPIGSKLASILARFQFRRIAALEGSSLALRLDDLDECLTATAFGSFWPQNVLRSGKWLDLDTGTLENNAWLRSSSKERQAS